MTALECFSSLLDWRWITTALVFVVTYLLGRFYYRVSKYPKGPFPLPLVGNLLDLRRRLHFVDGPQAYGDAERLRCYSGSTGGETARFRRSLSNQNRRYAASEALEQICTDIIDAFADSLKEGPQIMDFRKPIFSMFCKVIGVAIYGTRLREEYIDCLEDINRRFYQISPNGLPSDIAPFLAILYYSKEKKMAALFCELKELIQRLFSKAEATYTAGSTENFTHAMLAAREEAIKEDRADAQYLTKPNMILATMNIFNAGTNTSTATFQWLLLRIAKEHGIQDRIQKEIEDNIGSVPPVYGDREKLPFTEACLLETMRMHPAAPLGLPHNSTTVTRVGKWDIPKDTGLWYNIYKVHRDPEHWENPEEFRPERFLDPVTGKLCPDVGSLITFGLGTRCCPGEKLAQMDMFYLLVRLMQRFRAGDKNSVSVPRSLNEGERDIPRLEEIDHEYYEVAPKGLPSDVAPFLGLLYHKSEKKVETLCREYREIIRRLLIQAEKSYYAGI
ncbi:hypothetical protein MTO96_015419 [Rhipicephalus appendiculatus]